jgi:hypothetical protein
MGSNDTGIFGGSWLFAFLIIALLFGGGNGLGWGNSGASVESQINTAINNQTTQAGLRDVLLSSANNNYETARLISDQTMATMQQNNTNLINAIQGFNAVTQTITTQGASIQDAISRLSYQLDSCCCGIKTQMLQDKYDALAEKYRTAETNASNAAQSEYLLSVMGKWVANAPAA